MKYSLLYNLNPADRIVGPLFQTGLTKHHAIFLGEDDLGQEWIAENHYIEGVRVIPASMFFKTNKIDRIERFKGNNYQRRMAIEKAQRLIGKPYNLFTYNCEHYANEVLNGKVESRQVATFFAIAIGALFIGMAASD
ncbi:MAG TPA: YiiX/YebB-like N1pC/P60 family cysteine hydrolase [Chitinophagaceae bacterium]